MLAWMAGEPTLTVTWVLPVLSCQAASYLQLQKVLQLMHSQAQALQA